MIIFDLINITKLRRAILYAVTVMLTVILQYAVLPRFSILGVRTMFVPAAVAAVGVFEGGLWGGIFGLLTGVACDFACSGTRIVFTVALTAVGFFSGLLADTVISRRFCSCLILSFIMLFFTGLCQSVPVLVLHGAAVGPLLRTAALQALWSLPFAVPEYFACRAIAGRDRLR